MEKNIPIQTLQRIPTYLNLLKEKNRLNVTNISARIIASELNLSEIKVRKDLAMVSDGGKPKVGYVIEDLIKDIESSLGYDNTKDAVLVGAGKLGKALLSYKGFSEYGLNIVAAFDKDENACKDNESGKAILSMDKLNNLCKEKNIKIGIITVNGNYAQEVCDLLIESGVCAIWNFAPVHLKADKNILIKNENMASSLSELSNHLKRRLLNN